MGLKRLATGKGQYGEHPQLGVATASACSRARTDAVTNAEK